MSKSSKIKAIMADLNKITVSAVVGAVDGIIGDCQQHKWPADSEVGAFTTVGDVARHVDVTKDEFIIGDIVGAVLGRMTHHISRMHGIDPGSLTPDVVMTICNATNNLHLPAINKIMNRSTAIVNS